MPHFLTTVSGSGLVACHPDFSLACGVDEQPRDHSNGPACAQHIPFTASLLIMNSHDKQVSNLYPFESVSRSEKPFDVCVENIDIGGPTMIRAAAKNHAFVTVITSPSQFPDLIADMEANGGCTSLALRKRFAAEAFRVTAHYDSMIARWMCEQVPDVNDSPQRVSIPLNKEISLKYGCNPHQLPASVYSITGTPLPFEVSDAFISLLVSCAPCSSERNRS